MCIIELFLKMPHSVFLSVHNSDRRKIFSLKALFYHNSQLKIV